MPENFTREIGQSRPCIPRRLDDFVQLTVSGMARGRFRPHGNERRLKRQGKKAELEGESIRRGKRAAPDEHGEKCPAYDWRLTLL